VGRFLFVVALFLSLLRWRLLVTQLCVCGALVRSCSNVSNFRSRVGWSGKQRRTKCRFRHNNCVVVARRGKDAFPSATKNLPIFLKLRGRAQGVQGEFRRALVAFSLGGGSGRGRAEEGPRRGDPEEKTRKRQMACVCWLCRWLGEVRLVEWGVTFGLLRSVIGLESVLSGVYVR
jgi:hypothetical protein